MSKALGHYSHKATGGGATAARRFSAIAQDGARLIQALAGIQSGAPTQIDGIFLPSLTGMPCDTAIDLLITALSAGHGDSEKVRAAMHEALCNALDGQQDFNPESITDDVLVDVLLNYLGECVFLDIVANGADALSKATDGNAAIEFENMLRQTVTAAVDSALHSTLGDDSSIASLGLADLKQIQQHAIRDVWDAWRGENQ